MRTTGHTWDGHTWSGSEWPGPEQLTETSAP